MRIRWTNGLERLHGESSGARAPSAPSQDRASALRLIAAVALQTTSIWRDRIYLDMSALDPQDTAAA